MTSIEFILSVAVVGMVVLQCVILLELRETRRTIAAQGSMRRLWTKVEHE